MALRTQSDAAWVLDLCDAIIGELSERQHALDWLRGDPSLKTGLRDNEVAFYDAMLTNDRAREATQGEAIRPIAHDLTGIVRRGEKTDWQVKESVHAKLRTSIKRLLLKHGYPARSGARRHRAHPETGRTASGGCVVAIKLEDGYEAVGYLEGFSEEPEPAYLLLSDKGADITVPQSSSSPWRFFQANNPTYEAVPGTLKFMSTDGPLLLRGCQRSETRTSTNGVGSVKIGVRTVIHVGRNAPDYDAVDGMTSEIDGLAIWAGMSAVERSFELDDNEPKAYVIRASNKDSVELGGSIRATAISSFTPHIQPLGDLFGVTDRALLRTESDGLVEWHEHEAVHHMFQDLMCLAYGKPCISRIVSVKREDCQPDNGIAGSGKRLWNDAYQPDFGRTASEIERLDRAKSKPLFYLSDTDRHALAIWISEWNLWSRPTWIAVTTMFQTGTTAEAGLLQVGVALEALGYAIWLEGGGGSKTPSYVGLLACVTKGVSFDGDYAIYGTQKIQKWRQQFSSAFMGVKHADKELPDAIVAYQYARQGMNLIRAWTGIKLGVDPNSFGEFR